MKITDIMQRALKTFVQAFIPVIIANAALIGSHIASWDWADWKAWLLPVLISAVAAGLSALWNALINLWNAKNDIRIQESKTGESADNGPTVTVWQLSKEEDLRNDK